MLPAGIVADSRPRNAQSVSAADGRHAGRERAQPGVGDGEVRHVESHHAGHADEHERQQLQERGHDLDPARRPYPDNVDGMSTHTAAIAARGSRERRELGNEGGSDSR